MALYSTAYLKHVQTKRRVKFCVLILKEYLKAYFFRFQNRPTYISKNFNNLKHLAFVKTGTRDIYFGRSTLKVLSSDHDWFWKRSIEIFKYWTSIMIFGDAKWMAKNFLSTPHSDRHLLYLLNPRELSWNFVIHSRGPLRNYKTAWRPTTARTITFRGVRGIEMYGEAIFRTFTKKIRIFLFIILIMSWKDSIAIRAIKISPYND